MCSFTHFSSQDAALITLSRLAVRLGVDLSALSKMAVQDSAGQSASVDSPCSCLSDQSVDSGAAALSSHVNQKIHTTPSASATQPEQKPKRQIITGSAAELPLEQFLLDFWTPDKSAYVRDRRAHGHGCTERHCHDMRKIVLRSVVPYFGAVTVGSISDDDWDDFFLDQKTVKGLSSSSVNHIINACKKPFDFAVKKHLLSANPFSGIERFAANSKERGILSDEEVSLLFSRSWRDPVAKLANMVAAFCGLRIGEVEALRVCDVGDDCIHVMHNWSTEDGLKCPKNGESRRNPLPASICMMLREQAKLNPVYSDTSFVFFSQQKPEQPLVNNVIEESFYEEMRNIGISEQVRKERNIVFHSWRHYYATMLMSELKINEAQQALGHKTAEMTEHYSNHETKKNYQAIEKVINESFVHLFKVTA